MPLWVAIALAILFGLPLVVSLVLGALLVLPFTRDFVIYYLAERGILWARMADNLILFRRKGKSIIEAFIRFSSEKLLDGVAETIRDLMAAGISFQILVSQDDLSLIAKLKEKLGELRDGKGKLIDINDYVKTGNRLAVWIGFKPVYDVAPYAWTADLEFAAQAVKHGISMADDDFVFPKEPPSAEEMLKEQQKAKAATKETEKGKEAAKPEGTEGKKSEFPVGSYEWLREAVRKARDTHTPMDPDDVRRMTFIHTLQSASGSQVRMAAQVLFRIRNGYRFKVNGDYWMDKIRGHINGSLLHASAGVSLVIFEEGDLEDRGEDGQQQSKLKTDAKAILGQYAQILQRRLNILMDLAGTVGDDDPDKTKLKNVLEALTPRMYYQDQAGIEIISVKLQDFEPASAELRDKLHQQDGARVDANNKVVTARGDRDADILRGQGVRKRRIAEISALSPNGKDVTREGVNDHVRLAGVDALRANAENTGNRLIITGGGNGGTADDVSRAAAMAAGVLLGGQQLQGMGAKSASTPTGASPADTGGSTPDPQGPQQPADPPQQGRQGKRGRRDRRDNRGGGGSPNPPKQ